MNAVTTNLFNRLQGAGKKKFVVRALARSENGLKAALQTRS